LQDAVLLTNSIFKSKKQLEQRKVFLPPLDIYPGRSDGIETNAPHDWPKCDKNGIKLGYRFGWSSNPPYSTAMPGPSTAKRGNAPCMAYITNFKNKLCFDLIPKSRDFIPLCTCYISSVTDEHVVLTPGAGRACPLPPTRHVWQWVCTDSLKFHLKSREEDLIPSDSIGETE
jgi:hypothetical protein